MYGAGTSPSTDEILMTRPRRRARMWGRTALVMRTRPKKLTSKTRWSWATELSSAAPGDDITDQRANRLVAGHVEVEERHSGVRGDTRGVAAGADHLETGLDEGEGGSLADA